MTTRKKYTRWEDLQHKASPEQRQRIKAEAQERAWWDYHIDVEEIVEPLPAGQRFAAKIVDLTRRDVSGRRDTVTPPIAEHVGRTSEEAETKALEWIEDWIRGRGMTERAL